MYMILHCFRILFIVQYQYDKKINYYTDIERDVDGYIYVLEL